MAKKWFSPEQIVTLLRQIEGIDCLPGSRSLGSELLPLAQGIRWS